MRMYRIILADDHILIREGLKRVIEEKSAFKVISEASDGLELINNIRKEVPDMVILDIAMPRLRGIEAAREIKGRWPKIKILILTMHKDKEYLDQAFKVGVEGYLLKDAANKELFLAIEKIRSGKVYISPFFSNGVADEWAMGFRGQQRGEKEKLTIREKEILKLVSEGKKNKEIATLFYLSVRTVEHHRENMMRKLGLKTTADLVKYAIRMGYI
jgi:DNA-binding NarL/FixJ family response regulator